MAVMAINVKKSKCLKWQKFISQKFCFSNMLKEIVGQWEFFQGGFAVDCIAVELPRQAQEKGSNSGN